MLVDDNDEDDDDDDDNDDGTDDVDGNAHIQQERACKAAEELKWVGASQNLVTIAIVMRIDDGPVLVMMMARTIMAMMERMMLMMATIQRQ